MNIDKLMNLIAGDLQINAMPFKQYCYEAKSTHQIIRKHLTEQVAVFIIGNSSGYGVGFSQIWKRMIMKNDFNYKWSKLFASKRYNTKDGVIKLTPEEQQELLDDSEKVVKNCSISNVVGGFWSDDAITRLKAEYFEKGVRSK